MTGVAILGAVVVVVLVASINDYQKEKQFRKCPSNKQNNFFYVSHTHELTYELHFAPQHTRTHTCSYIFTLTYIVVIYVVTYIIGILNK